MLYVLFEAAIGYSLFEVAESEEIGIELDSVQVSNRKITFEKKNTTTCVMVGLKLGGSSLNPLCNLATHWHACSIGGQALRPHAAAPNSVLEGRHMGGRRYSHDAALHLFSIVESPFTPPSQSHGSC